MYTVETLRPNDHQLIGDIIADSFSDDELNLWIFGSNEPMKHYFTLAAKKLYLKKGFGHVVLNGERRSQLDSEASNSLGLGGAIWLPPGIDKEIPAWNSLDIAFHMMRYGGFQSISRGLKVDRLLQRHKPKLPHYYLYAIGSRQQYQGQGVGTVLMNEGLERADKEGVPVYLESSKESNVPYYRRFGFELIACLHSEDGGPPIFPMWRDPQTD